MFDFDTTSEEPNKKAPLREGVASFKVLSADDKDKSGHTLVSRAGNQMMKVLFSVTDSLDNNGLVSDYFLAHQGWKVAKLLSAVGRGDWFKSGRLIPSNLKGLTGQCILKKETAPEYPDTIKIASYIEMEQTVQESSPEPFFGDDDIPF